jgi:YbbR domain-containing protein
MKNILYYFLCLFLFISCNRAETNNNSAQVTTPAKETGKSEVVTTEHPVKVTQKSLEHIISRHWATSDAEGAGKF